jgi:hypothetical protein
MGSRTIITASEKIGSIGLYLHWNGSPQYVMAFVQIAKERGYRAPSEDESYALARLCGLACDLNDFEMNRLSVGLVYAHEGSGNLLDHGYYVVSGDWELSHRPNGASNLSKVDVAQFNPKQLAQYEETCQTLRDIKPYLMHKDTRRLVKVDVPLEVAQAPLLAAA